MVPSAAGGTTWACQRLDAVKAEALGLAWLPPLLLPPLFGQDVAVCGAVVVFAVVFVFAFVVVYVVYVVVIRRRNVCPLALGFGSQRGGR